MPTLREAVSYNHWVCLPLNSTTKGQRKRRKATKTLTVLMRLLPMKALSEMTALGTISPSASQCEAITAVTCSWLMQARKVVRVEGTKSKGRPRDLRIRNTYTRQTIIQMAQAMRAPHLPLKDQLKRTRTKERKEKRMMCQSGLKELKKISIRTQVIRERSYRLTNLRTETIWVSEKKLKKTKNASWSSRKSQHPAWMIPQQRMKRQSQLLTHVHTGRERTIIYSIRLTIWDTSPIAISNKANPCTFKWRPWSPSWEPPMSSQLRALSIA